MNRQGQATRVSIDSTVVRDFLDPQRPGHRLAVTLFEKARVGELELRVAPQGHRFDAWDGPLRESIRRLVAEGAVSESPQLSYPSEETFPGGGLYPGQYVEGLREAWAMILSSWGSDGQPGRMPNAKDWWHVETSVFDGSSTLLTADRGIINMCRRLRAEHSIPASAMTVEDFWKFLAPRA